MIYAFQGRNLISYAAKDWDSASIVVIFIIILNDCVINLPRYTSSLCETRFQQFKMKKFYRHLERIFENLTSVATAILGNSVTFIFGLGLVVFWLSNRKFYTQDSYDSIRDGISALIFLNLFIIQRSFNHFIAALHIKVNELVASHPPASNVVINVEEKTEHEINELSKEYVELAIQAKIKQEAEIADSKSEIKS